MKSDKLEHQRRINEVIELLSKAKSNRLICQDMAEKYSISQRQSYRLIKKAIQKLKTNFDQKEQLGISIITYQKLFNMALEEKKIKECIIIRSRLDKLLGLETTYIEVKKDNATFIEQEQERFKEELEFLKQKQQEM